MAKFAAIAVALTALWSASNAAEPEVADGFEAREPPGLPGWSEPWARDAGTLTATLDAEHAFAGEMSLRLESTGARDWAFFRAEALNVRPGDVILVAAMVRCQEMTSIGIGGATRDAQEEPVNWLYGLVSTGGTHDWKRLGTRIIIGHGVATLLPRITGQGTGTAWIDEFSITREPNLLEGREGSMEPITIQSDLLRVELRPATGCAAVTDRRTGTTWEQMAGESVLLGAEAKQQSARSASMRFIDARNGLQMESRWEIEADAPEVVVTIEAEGGACHSPVAFPGPFAAPSRDHHLVVPMNEGVLWPVDDKAIRPIRLVTFSGHGIAMPWWGCTDFETGMMAIIETPDDAGIESGRTAEHGLHIGPIWMPSMQTWRYPRVLRYVFLHEGGYVPMCRRYRAFAEGTGRVVTLAQKRERNPNVDRLLGGPIVWCWLPPERRIEVAQILLDAGLRQLLFAQSSGLSQEQQQTLIDIGYITSRYDSFRTIWPPEAVAAGAPDRWWDEAAVTHKADGTPMTGWVHKKRDGTEIAGYNVCGEPQVRRAQVSVPPDLAANRYLGRFIDTTTAAALQECYRETHPSTRTQNRERKTKLLSYFSEELGLITGTETGMDWANPVVHYYEGCLSLTQYRLPDAGRNMTEYKEPTPGYLKFQVSPRLRVPLWELVYHDTVVATWYWGDATNKTPEHWDERDLLNVLYGSPPMFVMNAAIWQEHRERFIRTAREVCPVVRQVAYARMTDHEWLTGDRLVQRSTFDNGVTVTVNFRDEPFQLPDGQAVKAKGFVVTGG